MAVSLPASLQAHSAVAALLGVGAHRLLPTSLALSASPPPSPTDTEGSAVLDFSTKRPSKRSDPEGEDALNLSKPVSPEPSTDGLNSPLDLSVSSRKRSHDDLDSRAASLSPSPHPPVRKTPRVGPTPDFKSVVSPWTSPVVASHFPYFAAAVAAASSLSPKSGAGSTAAAAAAMAAAAAADPSLWNGKLKHPEKSPSFATGHSPTDATKALEKMSELSKLGSEELYRPIGSAAPGSTSRHSAWQSHWLNKGADSAKDVLKCVWCKQSFPSLAALTTHMKEAKHCGVNVPVPSIQPPPPPPPQHPPTTPSPNHGSSKPSSAELNLLIKETMPLPRKLVRGQDVWLGKGAEQTRQILKCMWCGQSFRSLAEMTAHMQQTQHYTNIISQEQIISWKSSDENKSGSGSSSGPTGVAGGGSSGSSGGNSSSNSGAAPGGTTSSHVSAVLTCKVCDQAFSSLKELSNHMVKNQHYKEHIMRSITESGGRRRQTREKRKKSLPVRKLLELERAQNELKNGEAGGLLGPGVKLPRDLGRDLGLTTKISCEKCGEKIETAVFVEHVRLCVGGGLIGTDQRNLLKSALLSPESPAHLAPPFRENRKCKDEQRSPSTDPPGSPKDTPIGGTPADAKGDSPSVLNAIEKLIEKSFDSRARHGAAFPGSGGVPGAPMGSSILKRLGIDESVDYTKPLVDPQTMNLLRNYHHQQQQHMFQRRERSGSESSSVSERGGSSAGRPEALTPDRKSEHTPRTTPDKRLPSPLPDSCDEEAPVKKEEDAEEAEVGERRAPSTASAESLIVKKEKDEEGGAAAAAASSAGDGDAHSDVASPPAPRHTPLPSASPASSERSTPRSSSDRKSSLGALSSMFDSLGGAGAGAGSGDAAGAKSSSHPLAALQKLCDKTETHRHSSRGSSASSTASGANSVAQPGAGGASTPVSSVPTPGSIVAFSWACNDAVMTADSIMKCAFCDTPFISKGAYRHHLSKMHFVKDGAIPDPVTIKAHQAAAAAVAAAAAAPPSSAAASSPAAGSSKTSNGSGAASPPGKSPQPTTTYEESPHSKFLKYTELAKQLSSKYV